MIDAKDYANVDSTVEYGEESAEQLARLNKALEAGTALAPSGMVGGEALRVESLEPVLHSVTFREEHIKFFRKLKSKTAYSTVEEWSEVSEHGTVRRGYFMTEMGEPDDDDPTMARKVGIVRFLRTIAKVSHVITLVRTIEEAINRATIGATLRLLRACEETLFFGDNATIATQFDGLYKQIYTSTVTSPTQIADGQTSTHIRDLRGATMTVAELNTAAQIIADNYGVPSDLFLSHACQKVLDNILEPQQRVLVPVSEGGYFFGTPVSGLRTSFGSVEFNPDVFIRPEVIYPLTTASSSKAPAQPSITVTTNPAGGWQPATGWGYGTYYYQVSAINAYGESVPSAIGSETSSAANSLDINITAGGGAQPTTGYKIYRSQASGGPFKYIVTIPYTASPQTWNDKNNFLEGTSVAFMLDLKGVEETMSWKQLAPLHKLPLAPIGPYIWWLQNLYGFLAIYAPRKQVVFRNVGV